MTGTYVTLANPSLNPYVDHVGPNLLSVRLTEQADDVTFMLTFHTASEARQFAECLLRQVALAEHLLMTVGGK